MATESGNRAETLAAEYLEAKGLKIIDRNWRNRWCELDIVARSQNGVHIVEVKYRARTIWGGAAEYVTPDKVDRLRRGAAAWQQAHRYTGPIQIDVVTVEGELTSPAVEWLQSVVNE